MWLCSVEAQEAFVRHMFHFFPMTVVLYDFPSKPVTMSFITHLLFFIEREKKKTEICFINLYGFRKQKCPRSWKTPNLATSKMRYGWVCGVPFLILLFLSKIQYTIYFQLIKRYCHQNNFCIVICFILSHSSRKLISSLRVSRKSIIYVWKKNQAINSSSTLITSSAPARHPLLHLIVSPATRSA